MAPSRTFTTPVDWPNDSVPDMAKMEEQIRDNIYYLSRPPRVKAYNSAVLAVASATNTLVTFDSESWDTDSMHSTASNTSQLVAPVAGLYQAQGLVTWANNATGVRYFMIRQNAGGSAAGGSMVTAGEQAAGGGSPFGMPFCCEVQLAAGDHIELFVQQNSGGSLNTGSGPEGLWFSMRWVSF